MIKKVFFVFVLIILCVCIFSSCALFVSRGEFISLQKAYDTGIITKEDLKSIAYYQNGDNRGIDNENFVPNKKTPETLSAETEKAIKETRAYNLRKNSLSGISTKMAKADDVEIFKYYGTYNNYVAVMLFDAFTDYDQALWEIEIDGVVFYYKNGNRIFLWKEI